jgi:hypothetical protein
MSFNRAIENRNLKTDKEHLGTTSEIHGHNSNGMKSSQNLTLPPMNLFGGRIRTKPQSGFTQNTLISGNGQLDFWLGSAGYVKNIRLEMEYTISTAAVSILPMYLIDRVEFHSTEGNIISTIYGDNVYFEKLHETLEYYNRIRTTQNLDASYNAISQAVGNYRILFKIPCFIDQCEPKLSVIQNKMLVRVFFSNLGVVAGSAANISVTLCDIIQETVQLSSSLEAMEQQRKVSKDLHFRFLNPVRATSQTINMVGGSQYDIRLTSANNLSAYLVFVIRSAPLTGANINNFVAIDSYELLDQDNTIQGLKITNEQQKIMSLNFDGDILNFKNIYVVPFTISVSSSRNGQQCGYYGFTSNEILRVYTPNAGWVNGNYRIDVFTYDYNILKILKGRLDVSK